MVTDIGKGKELEHFSKSEMQRVAEIISEEIDSSKREGQKTMNGAFLLNNLMTLENEIVDVWIEWNANINPGMNDIGFSRCIYFNTETFPDIVIDRYNIYSKLEKFTK